MDRASRFLSSLLRKPQPPSQDALSVGKAPERMTTEHGDKMEECTRTTIDFNGSGSSNLEQLLKKETFSRAEFEQFSKLLNSKITDVSTDKNIEKDPEASLPTSEYRKNSSLGASTERNVKTSCQVSDNETASPADVAKAYMDSRPSKPSAYALHLRSQALGEAAPLPGVVPFLSKSSDLSTAPGSSFYFSELPKNGRKIPSNQSQTTLNIFTSSPFPRAPTLSTQVLKRKISEINSDRNTFGPLSRKLTNSVPLSRQKKLKVTERNLYTSVNDSQHLMASKMKSLLNGGEPETPAKRIPETGECSKSGTKFPSCAPKSTKIERKILQHLHQLVSPSKPKLPELKGGASHGSPYKSAFSISEGQKCGIGLRRMKSIEGYNSVCGPSGSFGINLQKTFEKEMLENDGSSTPCAYPRTQAVDKANDVDHVTFCSSGMDPPIASGSISSDSTAALTLKKDVCQLQASVDSSGQNAENTTRDSHDTSVSGKELDSSLPGDNRTTSKPSSQKTSLSFLNSKNVLNFSLSRKAAHGLNVRITSRGENGFSFPVFSSTSLQPPPTPTMPTSLVSHQGQTPEKLSAQSESPRRPVLTPTFSFVSKSNSTLNFSTEIS